MLKFKVGDEVVIRDWDDMKEEFGVSDDRSIPCRYSFTRDMKYLCGRHAIITKIANEWDNSCEVFLRFIEPLTHDYERRWNFSSHMIRLVDEEAYKKKHEKEIAEIKTNTTYSFDQANKDVIELLKWCGYANPTEKGIAKVIEDSFISKRYLREIFRKHPNWDEDQQAIIFTESYQAGVDKDHLYESMEWFIDKIYDYFKTHRAVDFNKERYDTVCLLMDFCSAYENDKRHCLDYVRDAITKQRQEIAEEYKKLKEIRYNITLCDERDMWLSQVDNNEMYDVLRLLHGIKDKGTTLLDDNLMPYVNYVGRYWKVGARKGQKLSRLMGKIFTHYELDTIKQMKEVVHGGIAEQKDYGYNYYFAMFADAINPVSIKKYTVISINVLDYYTVSFGKNWSSCHTIDKLNRRNAKKGYHGQYSSGTESYMRDETSVVFYTVDENYNGEMWRADKDRRMMFHIANDGKSMVFGRMYPDSRDVGETGIPAQFRNVMQKVLSECLNFNNLWKVYRGTDICERYTISFGTHYRDYLNYSDCGISYVSDGEMAKIRIGGNPICPCCGVEHSDPENIFCDRHNKISMMETEVCPNCGGHVDVTSCDAIYCADNGRWYCDIDCAENDGVYLCDDDNEYHDSANRVYDFFTDAYYHDRSHVVGFSIGEIMYTFRNEENAQSYGFYKNADGEWERSGE